ncbi:hypothetical protein O7599_25830 [Streptomyces sp. WMMC500]|uniref:hypothetical protein n=1 Tax=Streptomyces sp. WMMC500 TaxID=3015154 RepID=UPI00248B1F7C|nr:hypothetical protein [Streptomyces sp. WMMC500]WBB59006.1 hypothetical protein O7599_25830 [Streptomyces sp. WMMC500]
MRITFLAGPAAAPSAAAAYDSAARALAAYHDVEFAAGPDPAALRSLDADVLVTADPGLVPAACTFAPARTLTVHRAPRPGHPPPPGAPELDALVVPTEADRAACEAQLGPAAPRIAAVPDDARAAGRWHALLTELAALRDDEPRRQRDRADRAAFHRAATAPAAEPRSLPPHSAPGAAELRRWEKAVRASGSGGTRRLVWADGQVAEVRDDLLAADAYAANLRLAADALEAADVPYLLLGDASEGADASQGTDDDAPRHRLAVDAGLRSRTCRALAGAYPGQAVYAVPLHSHDAAEAVPVPAELLTATAAPPALRLYRPYVTSGRTVRYGSGHGCDIEFWHRRRRGGAYATPRAPTELGPTLPSLTPTAVSYVQDRAFPTLGAFVADPRPPVHAVYTRTGPALRYSLRSLAMFAPWVRHIHVVAETPPPWLDTDRPGLTLVGRRHPRDGLSARVLPLADDVFLGRTLPAGRCSGPLRAEAAGGHEPRRLDRLFARRDTDVFCLGLDGKLPRGVQAFLEGYFPVPSPYERAGARREGVRA